MLLLRLDDQKVVLVPKSKDPVMDKKVVLGPRSKDPLVDKKVVLVARSKDPLVDKKVVLAPKATGRGTDLEQVQAKAQMVFEGPLQGLQVTIRQIEDMTIRLLRPLALGLTNRLVRIWHRRSSRIFGHSNSTSYLSRLTPGSSKHPWSSVSIHYISPILVCLLVVEEAEVFATTFGRGDAFLGGVSSTDESLEGGPEAKLAMSSRGLF